MKCKEKGCKAKTLAHGLCAKHYKRMERTGSTDKGHGTTSTPKTVAVWARGYLRLSEDLIPKEFRNLDEFFIELAPNTENKTMRMKFLADNQNFGEIFKAFKSNPNTKAYTIYAGRALRLLGVPLEYKEYPGALARGQVVVNFG